MTRTAYSKPPGDQFQQSTFRTEKSVSGLPSGSDREKEQVLPEGAATPKSVSKDGNPSDKGQGVGQRALPYGTFNGPSSGSGTVEKSRTKPVPGEQYGTPSKDDYGYLTRRTMTGAVIEAMASDLIAAWSGESDIVAYRPRKRGPGSYTPHPFGWRRHRQKPQQRNLRRKQYRVRRSRELQQARRRYRTRYRMNPRYKQRRKLCRKYPNRCKMRPNPRRKEASIEVAEAVPFLYGCDLNQGAVVDVTDDGRLVLELEDGTETILTATAFVATVVFLDEGDIDTIDYLVESADGDEPYGEPTADDVASAAALHRVNVPEIGTPEEQLDAIFEAVMASCEGDTVTRVAHETFLYDRTPASELSNNWLNRKEPTREVADTRPYKENAPGQWTRNRKDQTHEPSDGGYVDPNATYYQGGSGKVIPDDMRLAAAWGRVARITLSPSSPLSWVSVDFRATRFQGPLPTDEQGGFRAAVNRLDLDGDQVRNPGVARFMPQRWPFSDVVVSEVGDIRLDNSVGVQVVGGRMVVTGRARYSVQSEWGDVDTQYVPIRGLVDLSPAFERRLESIQNPPVPPPAPPASEPVVGIAGGDDRVGVLTGLLAKVDESGKALVLAAIDAIRSGRTLDEQTLKGLRHRLYRSNMRAEADLFRTASDRTAGVFQAPPGIVSAIESWAIPLYAGFLLERIQPRLDAMRRDPSADALAEIARVKARFMVDVDAQTNPGDTLVVSLPKVNPDGTVGTFNIGVRFWGRGLKGEPRYLLDYGDKKLTFRGRNTQTPYGRETIERDVLLGYRSLIKQLEDRASRRSDSPAPPDDGLLVETALLVAELRRHTDKAVSVKSVRSTDIPIDASTLAGWRYADRLPDPATVADRLRDAGLSSFRLEMHFQPRQTVGGLWNPTDRILEVDVPVYMGSVYPTSVAEFRAGLARMRGTIRHEAQHVGQGVLQSVLGLREQGGLPPRDIRNLKYDPSGMRPGLPPRFRQEHAERDIEFNTRLQDEIDDFVAAAVRIPVDQRRAIVDVWTGVRQKPSGVGGKVFVTREFFRSLKAVQRPKWVRAVSEFVAGVEAAGVRIPPAGDLP